MDSGDLGKVVCVWEAPGSEATLSWTVSFAVLVTSPVTSFLRDWFKRGEAGFGGPVPEVWDPHLPLREPLAPRELQSVHLGGGLNSARPGTALSLYSVQPRLKFAFVPRYICAVGDHVLWVHPRYQVVILQGYTIPCCPNAHQFFSKLWALLVF